MKSKHNLLMGPGILMLSVVLAFSQTPPSANQLLWLNADNGVTVSGGVVQTWTNQSGSVNNQ